MPLSCARCGAYAPPGSPNPLRCAECGQVTLANVYPLFIVAGASGSGKTTVIPALRRQLPECVVFDKDLLWGRSGDQFYNNWLRIAYDVAQCGRYSVICGTFMPDQLEGCPDRGLVGPLYFLNLHCSDAVRERRLRARPAWRESSSAAFIETPRTFASRLLEMAETEFDPPLTTVDTTSAPVEEVASAIATWIASVLDGGRLVGKPA